MTVPVKNRIISVLLKTAVIVSALIGIILSALAATKTFMGGTRMFMYFTIQSNIAVALISLIGIFLLMRNRPIGTAWQVIKFVGTVSITLTGAVFTFVLAPTLGAHAWNAQNTLTHVAVPVLSIADFFVTGVYGSIQKKNIPYVILPPLAYVIYAGIAYSAGWEFFPGVNYPYFFLNWGSPAGAFGFTNGLPFMGCVWWILALLLLILAAGYLYLLILGGLKKRMNRKERA